MGVPAIVSLGRDTVSGPSRVGVLDRALEVLSEV